MSDKKPLTAEEIIKLAPKAQLFFARNFGGAPADWTNEQIRTHTAFQEHITEIVRAVEDAHGIIDN